MHARPRFFAKVMGELLFWVGEDKMLFGSDYAIWEPKWQVEGLVDWDYPDETFSDYPAFTTASKKKILGLNAAKLYGVEVPEELPPARRRRDPGGARGRPAGRRRRAMNRAQVLDALGAVYDPELDEPITALEFVSSCDVSADGDVDVRLRLPTPQCAPNFAYLMAADARDAVRRLPEVARGHGRARGPLHGRRDQRLDRGAARRSRTRSPARPRASWTPCASCSSARRSSPASRGCARRCSPPARRPRR